MLTSKSSPIIVADCGPLIALAKIECLHILPLLFAKLYIPKTVFLEATLGMPSADSERIKEFCTNLSFTQVCEDAHGVAELAKISQLSIVLDAGESQAICLAEKMQCVLLVDEKLARVIAAKRGLPIVGVLGVLIQAKRLGHIQLIQPLLMTLQSQGYFLSPQLITQALILSGEAPMSHA